MRKQEIRKRCEELAKETAKKIGCRAWYEEFRNVLTQEEMREVSDLWQTMPGNTCWNDAFLKWIKITIAGKWSAAIQARRLD